MVYCDLHGGYVASKHFKVSKMYMAFYCKC